MTEKLFRDEQAFELWVDAHRSGLLAQANAILHNTGDAEDAAQQTITKVWIHMDDFLGKSHLDTWVHRINVNNCLGILRKRKTHHESDAVSMDDKEEPPVELPQSPNQNRVIQTDYAVTLLRHVSAEDRSLLLLKEVEGFSVKELCQMTGMNENTLKIKLHRARQRLMKADQRTHFRMVARKILGSSTPGPESAPDRVEGLRKISSLEHVAA